MKAEVRVSVVQIAPVWCNAPENVEKMKFWVQKEAENGAELIVFPELATVGYVTPVMPGDAVDFPGMTFKDCAICYHKSSDTIPGYATEQICKIAKEFGVYVVFGMSEKNPTVSGLIFNSAVLIGPEGIVGVHRKMHLPLMEKHYFFPGDSAQVFDTALGKIGIGICCDARTPELTKMLGLKGAEIVCNIWAIASGETEMNDVSPMLDTIKYRAYTRAQENGVFHLDSSMVGVQGKYRYIGHSCIAAPIGEILASSETWEEEAIRATLKEEDLLFARVVYPIYRDRRPELYGSICEPMFPMKDQSNRNNEEIKRNSEREENE